MTKQMAMKVNAVRRAAALAPASINPPVAARLPAKGSDND
ncbi:hypothetical protein SAMN06265795_113119 [Noviherbaspirillum humi]|uniref:Uncharacterized protein n=1 Tax=Noviherbaspirillum humi TaxID=1688639 RepID=A0A239JXG3_9BURK|nr:hypothetical protein SAMN06265795_113119 [Noviherbaspirillum humi]